jgi:dienelactone hydrolase
MRTEHYGFWGGGLAGGVLALLLALDAAGQPAPPPAPAPAPEVCQVAAANSFDGQAFSYSLQLQSEQPRHRRYALRYPSPLQTALASNNTIPAEYYLPANLAVGDPRRPAVIVLHILNGTYELERMLCTVLAENGVPAVMFFLPYYGERGGPQGRRALLDNVDLFTQCLDQSLLDVRRTADVLAARPEVDPGRLGVSGISLGALIAAASCGVDSRLQRAELILGGGKLRDILASARETRELRESLARLTPAQRAGVDAALDRVEPLNHAAALKRLALQDRLMFINAAEDEVIPPACTDALAEAAGMKGKVTWLPGMGHYTAMAALPQIIQDTVAFFAADLPAGIVPPPATASADLTPLQALVAMLQQVVTLADRSPAAGRCHLLDLSAAVTLPNQKKDAYQVALIRGSGSQFKFTAAPVPEVGTLAIGNGVYPWIVSRNGTLFLGTQQHDPAAGIGGMLDVQQLLKLRIVVGAALAMAAAPEAFAQYVQVVDAPAAEGDRAIEVTLLHPHLKGHGSVRLRRDTLAPVEITFSVQGVEGVISVRQWALDTIGSAELFREPTCATVTEVPQPDVLRMFAATFNFLMEKAQ